MSSNLNRRAFLTKLGLGCAEVGAISLLSGIGSMGMLQAAVSANKSWVNTKPMGQDYKALVCIMLAGGNDSFNMLVPKDNDSYNEYAAVRPSLAIPQSDLLELNPNNVSGGRAFGLHPNMPKIKNLFESEKLSFIANIGALQRPTTLTDYNSRTSLPLGLFSHSDQQNHWQTSVPGDKDAVGWGGRLADLLSSNNENQDVSMSISFDGLNLFQRGNTILPYTATRNLNGSVLLNGATNSGFYESLKRETIDNIMEHNHANVLEQAYANVVSGGKDVSVGFDSAVANGVSLATEFDEEDRFQERLKMTARIMAARSSLSVSNQTFFISLSGFDTHDNHLDRHSTLMQRLDDGLHNFRLALEELGLEDCVTTFTMSDFGRKLASNGDGSDHGWGGHSLVMGPAVPGKRILGQYPELFLGNPLDTGSGRFIPTTSTDELYAQLALWFGASDADLSYILPNLSNFWVPGQGTTPLGV